MAKQQFTIKIFKCFVNVGRLFNVYVNLKEMLKLYFHGLGH